METTCMYIVALAIALLAVLVLRIFIKLAIFFAKIYCRKLATIDFTWDLIFVGICTFVIALYFFLV